MSATSARGQGGGDLRLELESALPDVLPAARGTALFLFGTCFHSHRDVVGLEVLVDAEPHRATAHGMPRLDLYRSLHPHLPEPANEDPESIEDPEVRCYRSGFWATVPIEPPVDSRPGGEIVVAVRARLQGGDAAVSEVGRIRVGGEEGGAAEGSTAIAICMSTFDPDMDLFRSQVESLRAQSEVDWMCFVSDDCSRPDRFREIQAELAGDERFVLSRSERRLGFYRSFERALAMVPAGVQLVALSDQDDRWHPDKLATLRRVLEGGSAMLAYSDQRLVDPAGTVLSETYWTDRFNNHDDLTSLLIANTITGAASMMRREVVERALPFPEVPGEQYHDHWLGLVAMTLGELAYVDRPLYDYVQHGGAALGHAAANAGLVSGGAPWRDRLRPSHWKQVFAHSRSAYFRAYVRLEVLAQVLLVRAGRDSTRSKRRELRRFVKAQRSPLGLARLALRPQRRLLGRNETLGVERILVQGILWRYLLPLRLRASRPTGSHQDASMPPSPGASGAALHRDPETAHIERMITPLQLSISDREPERINLLIPTIDLRHLFGGYIAKFNLARKLAESGRRVRIVAVDPTPTLPSDWREQVESYSGLAGTFSKVEVAFAREADANLPVNPNDRFIATTWWTAHLAREAIAGTRRERFLYLIQEYEPFTFVMGSWAAIAMETYTFPHVALFSTELLRSFFAKHGHGVYAAGAEAGERDSTAFRNAITPVEPPSAAELENRTSRRLLFYARSEPHAKRNLFELGLVALSRAVAAGTFGPEWQFVGIGGVGGRSRVGLPGGASLDLLTRRKQTDYGAMLAEHDVGLSLMFTPHPSLVPLEMASAGLLTVTNSFETKTAAALRAISPNLVVAEPTIEAVAAGLELAVAGIDDHQARIAGAALDWSRDWEDSFGPDVMANIDELLERC